jgi:hypothetical protein
LALFLLSRFPTGGLENRKVEQRLESVPCDHANAWIIGLSFLDSDLFSQPISGDYHVSCRISSALLGNAGGGTETNPFQKIH